MEQPRSCVKVIDEILQHIPEEQTHLIVALENARIFASFKPPEDLMQWDKVHWALMTYMGHMPTEEWQFQVWSVFTTTPVELIKEEVNKANQ